MMKLHEPTDARGASSPGYAPAGTLIGLRNACVAKMRLIPSASGARNRAPAGPCATALNPGQPRPPPPSAATRPSSPPAGPAPAGAGLGDAPARDEGEVEWPRLEERDVLGAAFGVPRLDRERRVSLVDDVGNGRAVDGESPARRRGPEHDDGLLGRPRGAPHEPPPECQSHDRTRPADHDRTLSRPALYSRREDRR